MRQELPISGPLSIGELLDRAFRLYRARFGALLLTAAVLLVPLALVTGLLTGQFMTGYMNLLEGLVISPADSDRFLDEVMGVYLGAAGVILLLSLITVLVSGVVSLALAAHTIAILHGQTITLGRSYRQALRSLWRFLVMNLVKAAAILSATLVTTCTLSMCAAVVFLGSAGTASVLLGGSDAAIAGAVLLVLLAYLAAALFMFLPYIYFSARWIGAMPALVAEELGALAALRRSWRLTRGQVARVVGYAVLLFLFLFLIVSLPLAVVQQVLLALLPEEAMGLVLGASTALSSILSVLWQPLYVAALVLLYYDLRVRQESYDVALRIQQLEADVLAAQTGLPANNQLGEA